MSISQRFWKAVNIIYGLDAVFGVQWDSNDQQDKMYCH